MLYLHHGPRRRTLSYDRRAVKRLAAIAFATIISASGLTSAGSFSGKVVGVSDGDTIRVMHGGQAEVIRLFGIDCPESYQPFGARAKQFTAALAFGRLVNVSVKEKDRYGRQVAQITLPDGRNLERELVRAGLAWWYRHYTNDPALAKLEAEARSARRGLWSDARPVPPWEYRSHGKTQLLGKKENQVK
jgi:micrococcal nuclease